MVTAMATLARVVVSCGGSNGFSGSPCQMLCEKRNSCVASTGGSTVPCDAICVYGGNYYPGLAPAPVCPNLAAQTACIKAAVAMSCSDYDNAFAGCPACPPLDGSPCASDQDCAKYAPNYKCDLSRPGGYCTAPCHTSDDCSIAGPEACSLGKAPSFDPNAPASQAWCLLSCGSDAGCRVSDGYACQNFNASEGFGVCDVGGAAGTAGSGGAAAGGMGGSGGGGAAGTTSGPWEQVTCTVSRTECLGWVENDTLGLDGTDVNCPAANLISNEFTATACFQTRPGSTTQAQLADAQSACDTWCSGNGGFGGRYPLGSLVGVAGSNVTCATTLQTGSFMSSPGQCAVSTGPSAGAIEFALCNLSGRACDSMQTAKDGTPYCASMPSVVGGESTSGCFDPTLTTAEKFCENGFQFPRAPFGTSSTAVEFPFWQVSQVELNNTEAECQVEANNIAFAAAGTLLVPRRWRRGTFARVSYGVQARRAVHAH
jgi:hypothetical protein